MRSIHGVAEPLLAAEIPLSRLEAHMTEQKWNLFQLATGRVARSAVSASSLTITLRASASLTSIAEILMPYKERFALRNDSPNSPIRRRSARANPRLIVRGNEVFVPSGKRVDRGQGADCGCRARCAR